MIPKVQPFDCYKAYLGLKNHFTRPNYDYQRYCGKSKASIQSFYKRKDRYFFEKLSRQKDDTEVIEFFVSNFADCDDPGSLWIGELVRNGETRYNEWKKRTQSLTYLFREESSKLFEDNKVDDVFDCSKGHPILLKKHLSKDVSLETMVIYDKIFGYQKNFDKKLKDPVWESVSSRLKKYSSFLHIDVFKYKKILKEVVLP
tara:strand:+ start:90 stop:692 length:603 start_codon:yes stop_codon:yes gene_type:complete